MGELTEPDIPGFLANVPLLAGFEPEALAALASRSFTCRAEAGDVVMRQGEPGDALFIVITGQVRVVSDVPAERVLLAHLGPGEFFGERSLLTGEPRNAAVVADVDSMLLTLSRDVFEEFLAANEASSRRLSGAVALREQPAAHRFHNEATSLLVIPTNGGKFVIGSGDDSDIRVAAPGVAARHALLTVQGDVCTVADLGSGNGTYLNQEPVEDAPLNEGDSLRIGGARLFLLDGVLKLFVSHRGVLVQTRSLRRTVKRERRVLLNDISLTIHPGELVAIVGPSGAGKTTLLRLLVGLNVPTSGTVTYDGRDLQTNLDRFRHHLGYVPQYDTLHLELSVDRSLHYAGRLRLPRSTSAPDLDGRITRLLDVLHLSERAGTAVGGLSGGQRKRTCVAAELLSNPGILCLDEPTSGLDPGLDLQLMRQLRELADDGRTVILTTHATRNIRICDRVVILCDGELVFDGAPTEALRHFAVDDFVEVYPALAAAPASELAARYARSPFAPARAAAAEVALAPTGSTHDAPPSTLYQLPQLLSRDARVLLADRVSTALRLFGAPLLGVLVAATFNRDIFALERARGGNAPQAITLLYLAAAICLFLGAFTSANVITRERGIYQRERLVNLSPIAYVLSKALVLSLFSVLQGFLFIAVLALKVDFPGGMQTVLALGSALALVSLAGMGMGLLISALSGNADRAAILVILALIPQLVFAGSTVPRSEMTPVSTGISNITITKWALELTGSLTGLDDRLTLQSVQTVGTPSGPVAVIAAVRPFENAFKVEERTRWLVLAGFCLLFLSATVLVQSRKR